MAYKITDKCIECGACAGECPVQCISQGEGKFVIDKAACIAEHVLEFVQLMHQKKNNFTKQN